MELNHIYTGDSLKILQQFPSESVDCVVTSPPYYLLRDYGVSGQIGLEHSPQKYIENLAKIFMECHRVLKKTARCGLLLATVTSEAVAVGVGKMTCIQGKFSQKQVIRPNFQNQINC
jgi:tRNA1(Val) A37 N6-methylase TrmN6